MSSPAHSFISRLGPNVIAHPMFPDVRFLETLPNFAKAKQQQQYWQALPDYAEHSIVIYRTSRAGSQFFLTRQRLGSDGNGRNANPNETPSDGATTIGYAIYAVPKGMTNDAVPDPDETAISNEVAAVCFHGGGHQGDPVASGPH